jgi:hypothetical protein
MFGLYALESLIYMPSRDVWCHRAYTGGGGERLGVHSHPSVKNGTESGVPGGGEDRPYLPAC